MSQTVDPVNWALAYSGPNPGLESKVDINFLKMETHFDKYSEENAKAEKRRDFTQRGGLLGSIRGMIL